MMDECQVEGGVEMKMIKRMICIPARLIIFLLMISVKLIVRTGTYIAGPGILLLGFLGVFTLIKHMWLQLEILAIIFAVIFIVLLFSVWLETSLEDLLEVLKQG